MSNEMPATAVNAPNVLRRLRGREGREAVGELEPPLVHAQERRAAPVRAAAARAAQQREDEHVRADDEHVPRGR
jgi:hypothetical protein